MPLLMVEFTPAVSTVPFPLRVMVRLMLMDEVMRSVPPPKSIALAVSPSLELLSMASTPPSIETRPVKVLAPLSVIVPEPTLVKSPAPVRAPEKVVLVPSPPAVRDAVASAAGAMPKETVPAPARDPIVSSASFRSSVAPEATVTAEESPMRSAEAICSVPAVMFVAPV